MATRVTILFPSFGYSCEMSFFYYATPLGNPQQEVPLLVACPPGVIG